MLITESQMGFGYNRNNVMNLLDNMNYLTEAESVYAPAMVPVVESKEYQAHIIKLEDMVNFSESNGIEDLGYALQLVCEASEIDPSTVAFTVQEDSIIADQDIADLATSIMNEGVRIAAVPVSPNHPAVQLANIAVSSLLETYDSTLFDYILQEMTPAENDKAREKAGLASMEKDDEGNSETDRQAPDLRFYDKGDLENQKKNADTIMKKAKYYLNRGRDFAAKYIAKLHDWAVKINEEMHNVDPKKRTILQSIKKKITGAIAWLTARLSKIGTKGGGYQRENPSYWDKKKEDNK